jgi:hypothetical protein
MYSLEITSRYPRCDQINVEHQSMGPRIKETMQIYRMVRICLSRTKHVVGRTL